MLFRLRFRRLGTTRGRLRIVPCHLFRVSTPDLLMISSTAAPARDLAERSHYSKGARLGMARASRGAQMNLQRGRVVRGELVLRIPARFRRWEQEARG